MPGKTPVITAMVLPLHCPKATVSVPSSFEMFGLLGLLVALVWETRLAFEKKHCPDARHFFSKHPQWGTVSWCLLLFVALLVVLLSLFRGWVQCPSPIESRRRSLLLMIQLLWSRDRIRRRMDRRRTFGVGWRMGSVCVERCRDAMGVVNWGGGDQKWVRRLIGCSLFEIRAG